MRAFATPLKAGKRYQKGVSLLLALVFCALFGGILVVIARFNSNEVRKTEARVAGWEMVEIAKAARLYMRDQFAINPGIRNTAATPTPITLAVLQNGGYLPQNFGRTDGSGNIVNALGQRVYVIMANWSNGALGGSVTDPATVPSAFVYFEPGGKANAQLTTEAVTSIRQQNAAVTAPLFDRTDTNISADCRGGGPAVGLWDTGCLTPNEFSALVGPMGLSTTFAAGGLIMPAWKAVQADLRAVLRYPTPENPGYATMLTDLGMGTPTGDCTQATNQVHITTTDASDNITQTSTNVCNALSDSAVADVRYNINRVANVMAQRLVAMPQTQDFGAELSNIGSANDDAMRINGQATLGSDLRVFNTRALPAGVDTRFDVPNGRVVVERNAYAYSTSTSMRGHATINAVTANALVTDQLNSDNFESVDTGTTTGAPQMNVTSTTTLTGQLQVRDIAGVANSELITETMSGPSANVRVTDTTGTQAQITGTLNLNNSTANVFNNTPSAATQGYAVIAGQIFNAGTVHVTSAQPGGSNNDLQFLATDAVISAATTSNAVVDTATSGPLPTINTTGRCLEGVNVANACADRQYVPPNITP